MTNRFRALTGLWLLTALAPGSALAADWWWVEPQEAPTPARTWSFNALAAQALATYPSVQAQQRQADAARQDLASAQWQRYPTPDLQASQDTDGDLDLVLGVQQPLWTGGRITSGIAAAQARLGAATSGVSASEQELLLQVAEVYVEAARQQASQRIAQDNLREHRKLLAMIARRVKQRISPDVDLALAESRLAQAASDLSTARQAYQSSLDQLGQLTGAAVLAIEDGIDGVLQAPATLDEAQGRALEHSPRLAVLTQEREAADADVRAERARLFPLVALRLEHRETEDTAYDADSRAMLLLESQLDAGFANLSNADAAAARRDAAEQVRRTQERELRIEVARAWQQWQGATARLHSTARNRDGMREVFASYSRLYAIGQKSWLDLLNTVRESTAAARSVEDARAEQRLALLRLAVLTGDLTPEQLPAPELTRDDVAAAVEAAR